jgi:release factor glutamine methyltransferase
MTVAAARRFGASRLTQSESPQLDADLLLAHVIQTDREGVLTSDGELSPDEMTAFMSLVDRRAAGEPVAYLTGWKWWSGLRLKVTSDVLIPRPETEVLVEESLRVWAELGGAAPIADIGVGSGAIAIGLAVRLPTARIIGIDSSRLALEVAANNIADHGVAERVTLLEGDLTTPLDAEPSLLVANLPYVPETDRPTLSREVLHEPNEALFAGMDGLDIIMRLLHQLRDRGWVMPVVLEIDPRQAEPIRKLVLDLWPSRTMRVVSDLSGRDRIVVIDRSPSAYVPPGGTP